MKKIIILLLIIVSFPFQGFSQDSDEIRRRAAEMVGQLGDYLGYMANKEKTLKNRQYYRKKALNLFIGKGQQYTIDGKTYRAVTMQTTSVSNPKPRVQPIAQYFTNLINLRYSNVSIKTTEIGSIKVSALKKIDEDLYECTCSITQEFIGYGPDGRPRYSDITHKNIKCYITVEHTTYGEQYIVQLGNVTATDTERL